MIIPCFSHVPQTGLQKENILCTKLKTQLKASENKNIRTVCILEQIWFDLTSYILQGQCLPGFYWEEVPDNGTFC